MKKLLWIFSSVLLLSSLFISTGCGDDDPIDTDLDPTIAVTANTSTTVVGPGQTVEFEVVGVKTSNDLNALEILEDGDRIDASRITIDAISVSNNPQSITGSDVSGFTWTVTIDVSDSEEATYTFILSDTDGNTDEDTETVYVETELEITLTGVLWNQAGMAGRGALDLDAGKSTGVNSNGEVPKEDAEIRDAGIDSTNTVTQFWRKQITYVNGTELRYVGTSTPEATFDDINSQEAIGRIFDAATEVSADAFTQNGPNTWGSYSVSEVVQEGDIFAVRKASGKTYLFRIDEINETVGNNDDNYELTIKY